MNEFMVLTNVRKRRTKGMKKCLRKIVPVLDLDSQEFISENVQVSSPSGAFFILSLCFCSF